MKYLFVFTIVLLLFGCKEKRPCLKTLYKVLYEESASTYAHDMGDTNLLKKRLQEIRDSEKVFPYFSAHRNDVLFQKVHILRVGIIDTTALSVSIKYWSIDGTNGDGYNYSLGQLYEISQLFKNKK